MCIKNSVLGKENLIKGKYDGLTGGVDGVAEVRSGCAE